MYGRRTRFGFVAAALTLLLVAVLAAGCSKNRVTVEVDVDSFMNEEDLSRDYDANSPVPVTIDIDPVAVNLFEGANEFASAEELAIDIAVLYDNVTGGGDVGFTVFFHDQEQGVYSTPPVLTMDASLQPATQTPGSSSFQADERVLELFTRDQLWMGLRFTFNKNTVEGLTGTYNITSIRARVTSSVEIF